jgi:hypothetical protein
MDSKELKANLTAQSKWLRLVYMIIFFIIYQLCRFLIWFIVPFQWLHALIVGQPNQHLAKFSRSLNSYIYQLLQFLCYNSDFKPFPFADWPKPDQEC